jgi:hypothetical protein
LIYSPTCVEETMLKVMRFKADLCKLIWPRNLSKRSVRMQLRKSDRASFLKLCCANRLPGPSLCRKDPTLFKGHLFQHKTADSSNSCRSFRKHSLLSDALMQTIMFSKHAKTIAWKWSKTRKYFYTKKKKEKVTRYKRKWKRGTESGL